MEVGKKITIPINRKIRRIKTTVLMYKHVMFQKEKR